MDQHAVALAENLDRANARARPAEDVLGEDRRRGAGRVVVGDLRDEAGHVDAGGAADEAGSGCVRPAALEAAVGLDQSLGPGERRAELLEESCLHDTQPATAPAMSSVETTPTGLSVSGSTTARCETPHSAISCAARRRSSSLDT